MKIEKIKNFKNGWFIGNFEPSLFKTENFEVSVQFHAKGFIGVKHYHKKSTEYNLILKGKINICGNELSKGDIFIFSPNEISESFFMEDTEILVVKNFSDPSDKYLC
jgi:quercetin dioxygenase-like cupin family protein